MNPESHETVPWPYSGAILMGLIALLLVGCAGGSARKVSSLRGVEPVPRPPVLLIYDFAINLENVRIDTTGLTIGHDASTTARLAQGKAYTNALSESLVTQFVKERITSRRATGSTHIPLNAIAVKGQFISIHEGDQTKRTTIGFGAGAEEIHAMDQVYQMRNTRLIRLSEVEVEAHGRKTPIT